MGTDPGTDHDAVAPQPYADAHSVMNFSFYPTAGVRSVEVI